MDEQPSLDTMLAPLLKDQRRKLAAQLRTTTEERAAREKLAAELIARGLTSASADAEVGGQVQSFQLAVYRSSRDGKQRVRITRTR